MPVLYQLMALYHFDILGPSNNITTRLHSA